MVDSNEIPAATWRGVVWCLAYAALLASAVVLAAYYFANYGPS